MSVFNHETTGWQSCQNLQRLSPTTSESRANRDHFSFMGCQRNIHVFINYTVEYNNETKLFKKRLNPSKMLHFFFFIRSFKEKQEESVYYPALS